MFINRIALSFLFSFIFIQSSFAKDIDTINIKVHSEGNLLDGILLKNSGIKGKIPLIIFLVGSGGNSSYSTNYKDFNQFFFEETFLKNGFALVYFDKRGVGKSEGIWYNTSFEKRALDAKNVALAMREFDFVDDENIFVIGHSQGGWIVQIAIAEYPNIFAGGISMAGPPFGVRKQLVNDYHSKFICTKGMNESDALKKASGKVSRELFFISLFGLKGNLRQMNVIKNFEAQPYLKRLTKPLLMLFGENDALVNLKWSMEELNKVFPQGIPLNIEVYEAIGETHSFKSAPKCINTKDKFFYSETTRHFLFEWLTSKQQKPGL